VRGNAHGLTAVMWVAGVGEGRGCSSVTTANRGERRRSERCRRCSGGGRHEGSGEVAR
jgi:hypothetical protein